jgi:hypothetical protein
MTHIELLLKTLRFKMARLPQRGGRTLSGARRSVAAP